MGLRILTWNLFHGRSEPDTPRSLLPEFSERLARFEWDVALLQEVPPWWTVPLARAAQASARMTLTSRNALLPVRRAIADRRPDLIKSWGGGCNAILVRGQAIAEHRVRPLRLFPERRVAHGVRLADGTWVTNLHGQAHFESHARADLDLAAATTLAWAGGAPTVLGGDCNLRGWPVAHGFEHLAGNGVDHVFGRGVRANGRGRGLDRPTLDGAFLSDHRPLAVAVERVAAQS
ncbi:MAG TPA: endonuclease/exonuclease/phosphatase family protein [Solirubrobacteraceae bacterium]|nr:endonuclease/exonuclease/phosphatase family protein [Solirubrobacteraceae bacterium]